MKPSLRCAIYTRVSTEHGLDQEFNSLDNQREAAEAYIKSQAHEGWRLIRDRFDDGGFSGGSVERPALQRLLDQVRARRIDVIVVYKVDRLTRSLADFAKLVELFDAQACRSSRSPRPSTPHQHGPADPQRAAVVRPVRARGHGRAHPRQDRCVQTPGLWMGGNVPLGYRVENRKLVPVAEEAETVRFIFRRYLELGSLGGCWPTCASAGL
jgi:DNA invertase Pin-like site-specific DNA recombinase